MKHVIALITGICFYFTLIANDTITVGNNTIKVPALGKYAQYYAFNEGDVVLFSMEEKNGKDLAEFEIIEYPSSSINMEYKKNKIENKQFTVSTKSIYIFLFKNTAISARVINFIVKRIPNSADTKTFNPTVYFRTIYDTTYQDVEETYLDKIDTIISERLSTNTQISSQNAVNGNSNLVKTSFQLPQNTIAWSYYISTSQEAQKTIEKDRESFTKTAKGSLPGILGMNPMAALALGGVSYFTKIQGDDNVKFQFSKRATQEKPSFTFKIGDTKGESNQVLTPLTGTIDITLTNDNIMEPINVTLKVTAVSVNKIYNKRIIKKENITSRSVPFTK